MPFANIDNRRKSTGTASGLIPPPLGLGVLRSLDKRRGVVIARGCAICDPHLHFFLFCGLSPIDR